MKRATLSKILFSVCFIAATAPAAWAMPGAMGSGPTGSGGGQGMTATQSFETMDTNKDGKVSKEEFFARYKEMKEAAFTAIDADADGTLTLEEWRTFSEGHSKENAATPMPTQQTEEQQNRPSLIPPSQMK